MAIKKRFKFCVIVVNKFAVLKARKLLSKFGLGIEYEYCDDKSGQALFVAEFVDLNIQAAFASLKISKQDYQTSWVDTWGGFETIGELSDNVFGGQMLFSSGFYMTHELHARLKNEMQKADFPELAAKLLQSQFREAPLGADLQGVSVSSEWLWVRDLEFEHINIGIRELTEISESLDAFDEFYAVYAYRGLGSIIIVNEKDQTVFAAGLDEDSWFAYSTGGCLNNFIHMKEENMHIQFDTDFCEGKMPQSFGRVTHGLFEIIPS